MPERMDPCSSGANHLVINDEENVHRADFFNILALHAVQPKHLGIFLLLRLRPGPSREAA